MLSSTTSSCLQCSARLPLSTRQCTAATPLQKCGVCGVCSEPAAASCRRVARIWRQTCIRCKCSAGGRYRRTSVNVSSGSRNRPLCFFAGPVLRGRSALVPTVERREPLRADRAAGCWLSSSHRSSSARAPAELERLRGIVQVGYCCAQETGSLSLSPLSLPRLPAVPGHTGATRSDRPHGRHAQRYYRYRLSRAAGRVRVHVYRRSV